LTTSTSLTATGTFVRTPGPVGRPRWDGSPVRALLRRHGPFRALRATDAAEDMGVSLRVSRMREPRARCGGLVRDSWRFGGQGLGLRMRARRHPATPVPWCQRSIQAADAGWRRRRRWPRRRGRWLAPARTLAGATSVPTDADSRGITCLRFQLGTYAGPAAAEPKLLRPLERSWRHGRTVRAGRSRRHLDRVHFGGLPSRRAC
jgi:hypothetical protein